MSILIGATFLPMDWMVREVSRINISFIGTVYDALICFIFHSHVLYLRRLQLGRTQALSR